MTKEENDVAIKMIEDYVEPGDIILTQTPSDMFGIFRDVGHTQYDHLVAVIDKERSLHISYPYAKLVPTILFIQQKKRPLILKSKMSSSQKERFIYGLKHNLVGKAYDYKRIMHFFVFQKLSEYKTGTRIYADRDDRVVCSHHLFKQLMSANPKVRHAVNNPTN